MTYNVFGGTLSLTQSTQLSTVSDRAFLVEQSAAHLSSNADCFSEPPENLPLFSIIYLTVFVFQFCTPCIAVV